MAKIQGVSRGGATVSGWFFVRAAGMSVGVFLKDDGKVIKRCALCSIPTNVVHIKVDISCKQIRHGESVYFEQLSKVPANGGHDPIDLDLAIVEIIVRFVLLRTAGEPLFRKLSALGPDSGVH